MNELILKIINMSISASWLVLAVLVLRLVLKKAPKWFNVLLWGLVAVRLLCPFSIESALSLIPSAETIPVNNEMDTTPAINSGINAINSVVIPMISQSDTPANGASINPLQIVIAIYADIWVLGVAVLLIYTAISYWRLRRKIDTAVLYRDNIFQSENVISPYVLGIIRPRIYLPFSMDKQDLEHVVAHEQAHIRRKDHWWKPLGFLLLTIHWFNPLMWLAYVLLCRDIEMACDEKVIKELGNEQRADYTQALLAGSVNRRMITVCPLAFGEVGVRERVKSVMNYKKPAFWIIVLAVIACVVVAVCFLTNPATSPEFVMDGHNVSNLDPQNIVSRIVKIEKLDEGSNIYMTDNDFGVQVTADFEWIYSQTIQYFYLKGQDTYSAQLRKLPDEDTFRMTESSEWGEQSSNFLLYHYLQALKYLPQEEIRQMAPADLYIVRHFHEGKPSDYDRVITYSPGGTSDINSWFIHLRLEPFHTVDGAYRGTEEGVIHLFYGN